MYLNRTNSWCIIVSQILYIRFCSLQVLACYLKRSSASQLDMFLKMDGFQLLAAQLFQYPTHPDQIDEAVSILLQRSFKLDDGWVSWGKKLDKNTVNLLIFMAINFYVLHMVYDFWKVISLAGEKVLHFHT